MPKIVSTTPSRPAERKRIVNGRSATYGDLFVHRRLLEIRDAADSGGSPYDLLRQLQSVEVLRRSEEEMAEYESEHGPSSNVIWKSGKVIDASYDQNAAIRELRNHLEGMALV